MITIETVYFGCICSLFVSLEFKVELIIFVICTTTVFSTFDNEMCRSTSLGYMNKNKINYIETTNNIGLHCTCRGDQDCHSLFLNVSFSINISV